MSYSSWRATFRFPCLPSRPALGALVFFLLLTSVDLGMPTPSVANVIQQAKLTAADATAFDEFGISVAVAGDTMVVGSHRNLARLLSQSNHGWPRV